ncbi:MAG: glycosyltransferase family 4 protein [Lachnospiraceae bacterium]|nr:glycosyltransferase family 4 protein [Lachnospiraceae bacterium]
MKILVECFWHKESGAYFTYGLAKGLKDNGVDVYALISERSETRDDFSGLLSADKIHYWKESSKATKSLSDILELYRVGRHFMKTSFDYTIMTFPGRRDLVVSRVIKSNENMMVFHDVDPHPGTDDALTKYVNRTLMRADNIIVLSQRYVQTVVERFRLDRSNVFFMRHGLMTYQRSAVKYGNADSPAPGSVHFLYFGRIEPYKGVHVLADAYNTLRKKYDNISLRIAGDGILYDELADALRVSDIQLTNRYIADVEVDAYFSLPHTVLVLPYLDATQSGVLAIAYDYAIPVISSDAGGLKEQLFNGEAGLMCTPGDSDALKRAMERFLSDDSLYDEECQKMRICRSRLEWKNVVSELLAQLRSKTKA